MNHIMDNKQRTSRFQCKKHFVSINKNLNRFCTDILFYALCTGYKISIYLLIFEHADIREIVEFTNDFEENNLPIVRFYSFMCNLKKILALVLAFACAFTMFAGAAFTDSADIKVDAEVVDTLVALGVVNGYDDGSFKPNGTVTRAEMAKMIYVLRTGNSDASAYNDDKTSFTDIGSHWARGYIKYCQSLGIIAGKSNTKFCPNDKVTAQEAAKMLLVTLGYDAAKAGLVGTNWAAKTNALADENGLLEDVNTSFTAACPRQYAAQLIYNTIDTPTVVWRDDAYTNVTLLGTDNKTVGEKYMGLQKWIGTFEGDNSIVSAKDGEISVTGSIDGEHKTSGSNVRSVRAQFKADFDNKYVGEEVSVLFKDGNTGTKNQPDAKDTIFGIYVTGNTKVYNIVKGDLQSCSDASKIKFNDKKYDVAAHSNADNDDVIVTNFNTTTTADTIGTAGSGATAAQVATYITRNYKVNSNDAIKFVANDDDKIVKAYVTTSKFGKVSSVTSSKIGVEGLGTKDLDDCVVYDGIKAGDLVQYVEAYQSSERKNIITKAETVEGKIEAFKSSDSQVRVNGNWYKFSANTAVATDFTNSALTANDVDDTYELIVDGKYYVAYNKISGFNNYAVATVGTTEFGDTRVKLLKADGSEVTTTVDELKDRAALPTTTVGGQTVLDTAKSAGTLFAYNLKSSDSKVDLSAKDYTPVASITSGSFNGDAKTVTYTASGTTTSKIVASDAAIFVFNTTDSKWKVYTAKDLGNFTLAASTNVQYIVDDNKIVALAVKAGSFPTGGSDSTAYGYVTNRIDTKLGDDTVVQLTIWNGSEEVTLNVDGSSCSAYRGDFVEYPIIASDAKANNSDVKVEPAVSGTASVGSTYFQVVKVKTVEDKRIITTTDTVATNGQVINGVDTAWTTTSDTVKIGVNTDDKEKSDNNSVVAYTKTFGDDYANAAIFYEHKNGYDEIKAIFIDSDNKLQSYVQDSSATATGNAVAHTVAAPAAAVTGNGLTANVAVDKTSAVQGETVTVTVTVTGTAAAAGTVNVSGVTATALNAVGSMTNATVNGTNGINVTAAVATNATFTYTFVMGAGNAAPTVTIA